MGSLADVRFFKVQDEASGEHLASFYLDPYSRPATKRGGAWMGTCTGKSSVVPGREQPVAYLTCNGSPPVGDKPSLMTFSEVKQKISGWLAFGIIFYFF